MPWFRLVIVVLLGAGLGACSTHQMVYVVTSGHPVRAMGDEMKWEVESYAFHPMRAVHDVQRIGHDLGRVLAVLRGHAGREWGRRDAELPSRRRYVKYLANYRSRTVVDFDTGLIRVETLDQKDPDASLRSAIITTLLTPDDPRAVDLFSDRPVTLSTRPYLYGLVLDQDGQPVSTVHEAEVYAWYLRQHAQHTRTVDTPAGPRVAHYVDFAMVPDHLTLAARRYAPLATREARRYGVSPSLVLAIIKTESDFNPFAVSDAPAYGLMQLVPDTGGRDAYRRVYGRDGTPSRDLLFDAGTNIALGTAYLSELEQEDFGDVRDPASREYCAIAAYNAGAGTVLRTFAADRGRAVDVINSLPPPAVYTRLRHHLDSAEGRRYLGKVLEARRRYVALTG